MTAQSLSGQILQATESRRDRIVDTLSRLVRLPSVSGDEGAVSACCAEMLRNLGLAVDVWEPDPAQMEEHPAYSHTGATYAGRPNVVGVLRGSGGGRSLILNGHSDVVPPGPADLWHHDPWAADIAQGRLYGRGAMDMKGGLAAMLEAVAVLRDLGLGLRGDVIVECVVDEERGGNGTLACILRGYRADAAIIAEPWGMDTIMLGHRGAVAYRITVNGEAKTLGEKASSASATEKMQPVVAALQRLRTERKAQPHHPAWAGYENPVPLLIGPMHGGEWFSSPPLRCTLEGVVGWLPPQTLQGVESEMRQAVARACEQDQWLAAHPPVIEFPTNRIQPCLMDKGTPLVPILCEAVTVTGQALPRLTVANAGSDQWLHILYGNTPAVQLGPGGGNAHAPDEFVDIEEVVNCTKVFALTAVAWCGLS